MCHPASMIVCRSRVLWSPDHDNHETLLREHHLRDDEPIDFVRCELVPDGSDYRQPISEWGFRVDQDILPDWWNVVEAEIACRKELPAWAAHHILQEGQHTCGGEQTRIALGNAQVEQSGGHCLAYDNAQVKQSGGYCYAYNNAWVKHSGGHCRAYYNAHVEQSGGHCLAYDNAQVKKI